MKNLVLFLFLVLFVSSAQAQSVEQLMEEGMALYDQGEYGAALKLYKKALKEHPKSSWINYEISMAYLAMEEYNKAIEHADIVIKAKDENSLYGYISKGNSLDLLGDQQGAIKTYKKAIKKTEGHYLLNYNLALTYYKVKEREKAEEALIDGISLFSLHSSTHLLLAYLQDEKRDKIPTLLASQFFLLIEPDSKRSMDAYKMMMECMYGNITEEGKNEISISISGVESEYMAVELMLGLKGAQRNSDEFEQMTDEEFFVEHNKSFYEIMGEMIEDKKSNVWWDFYATFNHKLSQSDHLEAYCMYISQIGNEKAADWVNENETKVNEMLNWVEENLPVYKS